MQLRHQLSNSSKAATMIASTPSTMSKSEFAMLCGVDKSRVSHWIKDARITGEALAGTGRMARIVVAVAQKQLRNRLDPYQMMSTGNGAGTKLDAKPPELPDADGLWWVLRELPATTAWCTAGPGVSLQTCYDTFADLRLNITGQITTGLRCAVPGGFEDVDWRALADEFGILFVDPKHMAADWNRRRLADD